MLSRVWHRAQSQKPVVYFLLDSGFRPHTPSLESGPLWKLGSADEGAWTWWPAEGSSHESSGASRGTGAGARWRRPGQLLWREKHYAANLFDWRP